MSLRVVPSHVTTATGGYEGRRSLILLTCAAVFNHENNHAPNAGVRVKLPINHSQPTTTPIRECALLIYNIFRRGVVAIRDM